MKATIYSLEGKAIKQIEVPAFFEANIREDLVRRAVLSDESRLYQPKGSYKYAGLETSAKYRGRKEDYGAVKNMGIPHLPHEVLPNGQFGKVKRVPHAVKGRRAHPPKPEKKIVEEVNKKEYLKALECAIAATADRKTVCDRCNEEIGPSLPIIVDNSMEQLKKTKEVEKVFAAMKLLKFIKKAKKKNNRAPLIVVSEKSSLLKAGRNLAGVDVVTVKDLKVKHLAPGTHHGRITLYTEKSLKELHEKLKSVEPYKEKKKYESKKKKKRKNRPRNRMGVKSKKKKRRKKKGDKK